MRWYRAKIRKSLLTWSIEALRPYGEAPAAHHRLLIKELQALAEGKIDRLMVFMPPGHAKTRYASILFAAWFLAQAPNLDVIGASYNAEFAEDVSMKIMRFARDENAVSLGYSLIDESRKLWHTSNGGMYRAAGARGGITGRRADLFIIDDPIKGREDADSLPLRDKTWNWYRAEVITRLKPSPLAPSARILLIETRWHEDDLAGRLIAEMENGGDQWRIISLPAIAETENDALGRQLGDPLWPEWEGVAQLERKRASVGQREWASLFQQRPVPLEGTLFKRAMISVLDAAPAGGVVARGWDLAATKATGTRDPDYTVGVKLQRAPNGLFVVQNVVRVRGGPDEVEATIVNTAQQDGPTVKVGLPQDPGQAGKTQVLYLARKLAGSTIESSPETGEKETRAAPVISQCNVGNLAIVRAPWNNAFIDELAAFPSGAHDDQVDALSRSFSMVGLNRGPIAIAPEVLAASRRAR